MRKNQRPGQVIVPLYILEVETGKPDFGAPNFPVRLLRYYHRYMTEHSEELDAASISRWICTTIVDFHATLQNSKNIPETIKAHEVCAVSSLQLFIKVDQQAAMKAWGWSSGGTFTSFYLPNLCPQADNL